MPRATRRTTAAQPGKENHGPSQRENVTTTSRKKARHRLSSTELARLEDVFKQGTHPSRQQKRDLAAQLGMDYKTVTIWFQNKRQTSKRSQPPVGRTRADSCLRAVSSPSHNATLDASEVVPTTRSLETKRNSIASKAIIKIKPLLDSLNALTSRPIAHSESTEVTDVQDIKSRPPQALSEHADVSAEFNDQTADLGQTHGDSRTVKWKRIRTLEWACERQTKRRKSSREGYVRLGSAEVQDNDPNDTHMDSALSLLSFASSTHMGAPKDVIRGASLLLSFKHSWYRK